MATVAITTKAGSAPCHFFGAPRPAAAVIIYMDAFGIRPAMCDMGQRLSAAGYHVLLPDLFYRSGPQEPFDAATAFADERERARLMALVRSITNGMVMEDTASYVEFLDRQSGVAQRKIGCVGYCMGGAFALSAAGTFPERVGAAAALHGARLATELPDSPHLLAPKMKGYIYVGIAGLDTHFTPQEKERLESALRAAGVRHTVETYPEVKHGFAVSDHPVYDQPAAERHWGRIRDLFAANLG